MDFLGIAEDVLVKKSFRIRGLMKTVYFDLSGSGNRSINVV